MSNELEQKAGDAPETLTSDIEKLHKIRSTLGGHDARNEIDESIRRLMDEYKKKTGEDYTPDY